MAAGYCVCSSYEVLRTLLPSLLPWTINTWQICMPVIWPITYDVQTVPMYQKARSSSLIARSFFMLRKGCATKLADLVDLQRGEKADLPKRKPILGGILPLDAIVS